MPCAECGNSFTYTPAYLGTVEILSPKYCDHCVVKIQRKQETDEKERHLQVLNQEWADRCPPLYQNTDVARIPAHYMAYVKNWKLGPIAPAFVGPAGNLKTRSAFELLKRFHFAGTWTEAISSTRFAKLCADQFDDDKHQRADARDVLDRIKKCALLLLDDLGKQKMSERVELELFDLLEYRTSNLLPTIWTANADGDQLEGMFSKDRGEPILRRLAEFSEIASKKAK